MAHRGSLASADSSSLKDPEKSGQVQISNLESGGDERDEDFGGPEARCQLERRLLWKLDARMSILVIIYILNYVSHFFACEWYTSLNSRAITDRP